jgi:amino acid transporter
MALLIISGLRRTLTAQKILFIISIIGVAIGIVIIGTMGREAFMEKFNELASYNGVIDTAREKGFQTVENWNLPTLTLMASLLLALSLMFAMFSQYAGGELKNFKKNVPISIYRNRSPRIGGDLPHGLGGSENMGTEFPGLGTISVL